MGRKELNQTALLRFSRAGELVLDLFLGAGTTAIEAERLGRRCLGVELKPELVEAVETRLPDAVSSGRLSVLAHIGLNTLNLRPEHWRRCPLRGLPLIDHGLVCRADLLR